MDTLVLYRKPPHHVPLRDLLDLRPSDKLIYMGDRDEIATSKDLVEFSEAHLFENYFFDNCSWEVAAQEICRTRQVGTIIAIGEVDLLPAARLRKLFSLPGPTVEQVLPFRDKLLMKQLAKASGLRTPHFAPLQSRSDLNVFIESNGLPAVVKPSGSACSEGVAFLHTSSDLERFLTGFDERKGHVHDASIPVEWQVEELIIGDIFHVDGFVLDGVLELCWPSRYLGTNADMKMGQWCGSVLLSPEDTRRVPLCEYLERLLVALSAPKSLAFHAELFFERNTQQVVLCEIAGRVAGALLNEYIKGAFGTNLQRVHALTQAGLRPQAADLPIRCSDSTPGWRGVVPRGIYGEVNTSVKAGHFLQKGPATCPFPYVSNYKLVAREGCYYPQSGLNGGVSAMAVCVGSTADETTLRVKEVAGWIEHQCVWREP